MRVRATKQELKSLDFLIDAIRRRFAPSCNFPDAVRWVARQLEPEERELLQKALIRAENKIIWPSRLVKPALAELTAQQKAAA